MRGTGFTKILPVLGAAVALVGFFLPFVEVRIEGAWPMSISAYQIISGAADVGHMLDEFGKYGLAPVQQEALERFDALSKDYGAAMIVLYIPAFIQLIVGMFGLFGRFSRAKGVWCLALGVASGAIAYVFFSVQPDPATGVKLGWGCIAIACAAIGGVIGGLGGVILPERDPLDEALSA